MLAMKFWISPKSKILPLGDLLRCPSDLDQFGGDLHRWMQLWAFGSKLEEDKATKKPQPGRGGSAVPQNLPSRPTNGKVPGVKRIYYG